MTTATQLGIDPEAIEAALDRNMTFPARWYSDPAIYDVELEHIFTRSWQLVAHESRIARPGDHHVCQVAHIPVVLTRGLDGELRGFVNVCRHRAYPVAEEDGNRKTLQCAYHGWTYELDGNLRNAPRCEHEPGFDKSEFSLVPVAVEVWDGFVFVNPDPGALSLAETYPELAGFWTDRHLSFDGYRYVDRYTYEIPANWKVWVENATECYHCPTVHKSSFSDAFVTDVDIYEYVNVGGLLAQFTPYNRNARRFDAELGGNGASGGHGFRFVYIWPTSFFAVDDYVAFPGIIVPTGPESCRFHADFWINPACKQDFVDEWIEMYNQTLAEDAGAVRVQQPGLRSRMVPNGRLMPASESSIAHFHRLVWKSIAEAVGVTANGASRNEPA
jgi:phenylpropionate dioxygenase-like ring-hydroxylating dioxygenase large terminal subunit